MAGPSTNANRGLIVLVAVVGCALLLCGGLAVWGVGSSLLISVTEKDDVRVTLDRFMRNMAAKDVASAYAMFSSRARRQMPISKLEEITRPPNYSLIEGYRALEIVDITVRRSANTNPDVPQGTVAEIRAALSYTGGFTGQLTSVLEKENGRWTLHFFNITVPPAKLHPAPSSAE